MTPLEPATYRFTILYAYRSHTAAVFGRSLKHFFSQSTSVYTVHHITACEIDETDQIPTYIRLQALAISSYRRLVICRIVIRKLLKASVREMNTVNMIVILELSA